MNDIVVDIDNYEDELDNIILSKKISNESLSKYFIYLDRGDINNLLIKIPPIRLLYNYSNSTFNQINFPLNPNYSKIKKFVNMISILENKLQEILNKPKLEWISNIKKIKNIKNIKLNYFHKNDIKIISNENINDIFEFMVGSEIEIIVHLSHLWMKEERIGISYDICQISHKSLNSILKNNYFEKVKISRPIKQDKKIVKSSGVLIPSIEMLENQRNRLKKID